MTLSDDGIYTIVIVCLMFLLLCFEFYPADMVVVFALSLLWCNNIVTTQTALKGWSNPGLITVACLYIVVYGAQKTGIVRWVAVKAFGKSKNPRVGLLRQSVAIMFLSTFLNNTPVVSIFLPIIKDWARSQKFAPSLFLLPLSFFSIFGGLFSNIGTSTNLVVTGYMDEDNAKQTDPSKVESLAFFDLAKVGLPLAAISTLLMAALQPYILPKDKGGLFRVAKDQGAEFLTEIVIHDKSPLVGKRILRNLAVVFAAEVTPVELLRRADVAKDAVNINQVTEGDLSGRQRQNSLSSRQRGSSMVDPTTGIEMTSIAVEEGTVLHEGKDKTSPSTTPRHSNLETTPLQRGGSVVKNDVPYIPVFPITNTERFQPGDRLIVACDVEALMDAHRALPGGVLHDIPAPTVSAQNSEEDAGAAAGIVKAVFDSVGVSTVNPKDLMSQFHEVVLSHSSPIIGMTPDDQRIRDMYDCVVIAARTRAETETAKNHMRVPLRSGSTLLLLCGEGWDQKWAKSHDFYISNEVGKMPQKLSWWYYGSPIVMCIMVILGSASIWEMEKAAFLAAFLNVVFKWVDGNEARKAIEWNIIILIGASFGIGAAMESTGVADEIGALLESLSGSKQGILCIFYLLVLLMTEIITNNAAAAIAYPIARSLAVKLNCSVLPFAVATCMAASAGYAVPTGYQTHLMVYGPGGYSFLDFVKIGIPMDIIWWLGCTVLIPAVFPFEK